MRVHITAALHLGEPLWLSSCVASSLVGSLSSCYLLGFLVCLLCDRWWSSPLLPLHPDCPGTCMSHPSDFDSDLVELSVSLAGLSVSVRGSPEQAAAFVRGISESGNSASFSSNHGSLASPSPIGSLRSGLRRSAPASSISDGSYSQVSAPETRDSIRRSFPSVPSHFLERATQLTGSRLSGGERIQRAWIAGCWAGATKAGRIQSPNRTPSIDLGNRVYVVIRCERFICPRIFRSSQSFHTAVGRLEGSDTICHGFPTDTEAAIYLEAAGEELPLLLP